MKQIFIFSDTQKDNISYFEREPAILVSMNRNDLPYLKEQDFANYPAIYVLIGGNKRYVGQAAGQTISTRLSQHFLKEDKGWVESVLFFTRADGKMSKADTDYLERRLIQDFQEKANFEMMNATLGNKSYIDKLQKAKSDHLYDIVFEIIDEIANIDLFGSSEENERIIYESNTSDLFEIEYNDKKVSSKSARRLWIDFVSQLFIDKNYAKQMMELVIDESPSFAMVLGRKPSSYNGKPNCANVADGIWVYTNFNKKNIKIKIEKLANQLNIPIKIRWK